MKDVVDSFKPCRRRTWLPVSTMEWMPSESMALLPLTAAAINLMMAIRKLPVKAA